MADNYPFDSSNVPYSAVFNQDYTADSALAASALVDQTIAASMITIAGGAGGTSGGVGGAGGSVTTLDTTYSASRGSYSGGNGGSTSGTAGSDGAGGGGAAGYSGAGGNADSAGTGGAGGGGGASTNQLLLGGGGVGLFGLTGDDGTAGNGATATAAGGGSNFISIIGDEHLEKVKLLLKGGTDTPYNLGHPEPFSVTRNGSTTGSSRFVTGKYGNAFDFNGTDDYLALSGGDLSGGDWTIEMWVNYDSMTQYTGPIATDMDKVLPTGNTAGEFDFHIRETSAPYYMTFLVRNDPNTNFFPSNTNVAITAGTWHHVAVSFVSSTNTLYIGVDGTVSSSTNAAFASISLGAENSLQIGRNRTNNQFFNGQIDDIRLTKGVARYTSSYTVPAAAHPIIHAKSGNNGFKDSDGAQPNYSRGVSSSSSSAPTGLSSSQAATSAAQILADYPNSSSGFYYININSTPTLVYCDMQNDGGGWMLVAKANGVDDNYWKYDDAIWTNTTLLNATSDPISTDVHIKTSVYTSYSFTQVRLAMEYLTNGIVESTWSGTNFASFMGSGSNSSNSRATWTSWVDTAFNTSGSSWLANCNQFGTNKAYNYQHIRIGGNLNGENDCNTNDESFGFGSKGINPYTNNLSCGAFSPYGRPSGRKKGWIFVK